MTYSVHIQISSPHIKSNRSIIPGERSLRSLKVVSPIFDRNKHVMVYIIFQPYSVHGAYVCLLFNVNISS